MNKVCKNCAYYSSALYVCFHPCNEGIRVFDNTPACEHHCLELTEDSKEKLYNHLFNNN